MVFNSDVIKKDLRDAKKRIIPRTINDIFNLYVNLASKVAPKKDISGIRKSCELIISESMDSAEESIIDYSNQEFMDYFAKLIDIFNDSVFMQHHAEVNYTFIMESAKILYNIDDLLSVCDLINVPFEYWSNNKSVFVDISDFTDRLSRVDIPKLDYVSIIMEVIKRNISAKILEQSSKNPKFSLPFIANKNGLTDKDIADISIGEYDYIYTSDKKDLTDLEKRIKSFMTELSSVSDGVHYVDKFLDDHRIVKEHYFDKLDDDGHLKDFDTNDVNKINSALTGLGVSPKIRSITRHFLIKEVSKKNLTKAYKDIQAVSFVISQQEYKKLRKKVEELFNMRSKMPVRELSIEEVYYCAGTMLEMGEEVRTIETLFDRGLKKEKNPIKRFEAEHDRFIYYGEKLGIEDQIKEMDEIYQEAIVSSDEYKKEWSKMLGDCLKEFEYVIPFKYRYEYEINKAKQYRKNQKRG